MGGSGDHGTDGPSDERDETLDDEIREVEDEAGDETWDRDPDDRWDRGPDARPDMRSRVRAVLAGFGLGAAGFVVGVALLIAGAVVVAALAVELSDVGQVVLGLVLLQGTAFPLVAVGYVRYRGLSWEYVPASVPDLRQVGIIVLGFVAALSLVFAALVVISAVDAPTAERADQEQLQNPEVLLTLVPLSVLIIGPGEELLFRGIIQGRLREVFSAPAAIVIASAAFAPAHIFSLLGSPIALAVSIGILFVPSLVFGYAYERTGNIVVPAMMHGLYNATLFGLAYVAVTSGAA